MLPSQILRIGNKLSSRLIEEDYTIKRHEFILREDGNIVLRTMTRPTEGFYSAYWSSTTTEGSELVFDQSASIYLTLNNRSMYIYVSSGRPNSARDYYQRAILDFDGVLRQYTYPKTSPLNGSWPDLSHGLFHCLYHAISVN
ncbi:hypothetical protein IFM89_038971 [Coptis chinensis]|uniref:Uncharacterized protein n=1 Tax=Coptis chinensis TaxID=261450 RepID=A0A835MBR9_9MAGN|nr:hypothetical protein IFM89_038971 [Coptis chinensis]